MNDLSDCLKVDFKEIKISEVLRKLFIDIQFFLKRKFYVENFLQILFPLKIFKQRNVVINFRNLIF